MNKSFIKTKGAIISSGIIRGDSSTVVNGNLTINNQSGNRAALIVIACVAVIAMLLVALTAFVIIRRTNPPERPANTPLKVGKRGGVYWVDRAGRRHYIDREKGMEIIIKNGTP